VKLLSALIEKKYKNIERTDIHIPSFGEDNAFVYTKKQS